MSAEGTQLAGQHGEEQKQGKRRRGTFSMQAGGDPQEPATRSRPSRRAGGFSNHQKVHKLIEKIEALDTNRSAPEAMIGTWRAVGKKYRIMKDSDGQLQFQQTFDNELVSGVLEALPEAQLAPDVVAKWFRTELKNAQGMPVGTVKVCFDASTDTIVSKSMKPGSYEFSPDIIARRAEPVEESDPWASMQIAQSPPECEGLSCKDTAQGPPAVECSLNPSVTPNAAPDSAQGHHAHQEPFGALAPLDAPQCPPACQEAPSAPAMPDASECPPACQEPSGMLAAPDTAGGTPVSEESPAPAAQCPPACQEAPSVPAMPDASQCPPACQEPSGLPAAPDTAGGTHVLEEAPALAALSAATGAPVFGESHVPAEADALHGPPGCEEPSWAPAAPDAPQSRAACEAPPHALMMPGAAQDAPICAEPPQTPEAPDLAQEPSACQETPTAVAMPDTSQGPPACKEQSSTQATPDTAQVSLVSEASLAPATLGTAEDVPVSEESHVPAARDALHGPPECEEPTCAPTALDADRCHPECEAEGVPASEEPHVPAARDALHGPLECEEPTCAPAALDADRCHPECEAEGVPVSEEPHVPAARDALHGPPECEEPTCAPGALDADRCHPEGGESAHLPAAPDADQELRAHEKSVHASPCLAEEGIQTEVHASPCLAEEGIQTEAPAGTSTARPARASKNFHGGLAQDRREGRQGPEAEDQHTVTMTVSVSVTVPASSTIRQVKQAFVQKLGQRKGASKIKMFKQLDDRLSVCEDADDLDPGCELFAEGVQVNSVETTEPAEPNLTGPSGSSLPSARQQMGDI